ncbi:MAG TPA: hypothetical protein VGJ86_00740 [Acidimicrobiales bacterium]|jgi:UDP-N-acetylmuramyl pentapeptide phosphotransferase/UDP-N-acetylglucosamine-1-phosphate transferase
MIIVALFGGAFAATVLWVLMSPAFGAEVFTRENYRGRELPTAAGVIIALVVVAGDALVVLLDAAGAEPSYSLLTGFRAATVVAIGFALLGLLDDLGGVGQSGGFRGHLSELAQGRLTTGAAKLFGGAALGVIAADIAWSNSVGRLLADGALIALAANLGNLFDRAPGRVIKVALVAGVVLIALVRFDDALTGVVLALGAAAGLLLPDLRERLMLGDTGANVLGAVLGLGVVLTCTPTTRTLVLLAVAALNAASEVISFTKIINQTPPLRFLDHLGRRSA